jgi:hypothetical protein
MASGLTESGNLIVEDGTGVSDANSYGVLAIVTAYVTLRQDAKLLPWLSADESNQVAAAIIATDYVDSRWRFLGEITYPGDDDTDPQNLRWPRTSMIDERGVEVEEDELPIGLLNSWCEYAARALDPTTSEARMLRHDLEAEDVSGRRVKEELKKIGPLVKQIKYQSSRAGKWPSYGNADELMKRSGFTSAYGLRTVRA